MESRLRRLPDSVYFAGILPLLGRLPAALAYRLVRWQGRRIYRSRPLSLERMAENLSRVFEGLAPSDRERIIATFCQIMTSEDLDAFFYRRWNRRSLSSYFDFSGLHHLEEVLGKGRGAILVTAHLGSPGAGLVALGVQGYPVTHVGRSYKEVTGFPPAYHAYALRKMAWMTEKIGRPVIYAEVGSRQDATKTALEVLKALRENTLVSVAIDVSPESDGQSVEVDFLGRPARFPLSFVEIAQGAGVPLLPYFTLRKGRDSWHRQSVTIFGPISSEGPMESVVQSCVGQLETMVRRAPEQWFAWDSLSHLWVEGGSR